MESELLIEDVLSRIAASPMTTDSLRYELRIMYEAGIASVVDHPKTVIHKFETEEDATAFRSNAMTAYNIWRFMSGRLKGQHASHDSKLL